MKALFVAALLALVLSGCSGGSDPGSAPTAGSETTTPTTEAPTTEAPTTEAPTADASSDNFKMPNLVGKGLQDAQDELQSLGSYVLRQDDASGAGRSQFFDRNWKVCSQKPAAGTSVPIDDEVVLASVKLDESCP